MPVKRIRRVLRPGVCFGHLDGLVPVGRRYYSGLEWSPERCASPDSERSLTLPESFSDKKPAREE